MPAAIDVRLVALVLIVAGCGERAPAPGSVEDLAAYLRRIVDADRATRLHELASWRLDRAAWDRTIVEPFRALRDRIDGYADDALGRIDRQLARGGEVATRRHFAGDPGLTAGQAMLRWVVPVLYPSLVAELDGAPIDTVFVYDGQRWRAPVGLDGYLAAYVTRYAAADCAAQLRVVHRSASCANVWFTATDAALRNDRVRFDRMCRIATTLCDMRSP